MGNHKNSQGLGEIILHNCTYAGCATRQPESLELFMSQFLVPSIRDYAPTKQQNPSVPSAPKQLLCSCDHTLYWL